MSDQGVKYAHTGEPLQIIELISKDVNGTIHHEVIINEANLRKIAFHPEVKNRHVEIVSISGASRGGKSFLMNFPLMYLEKKAGNWLTDADRIEGFDFRSDWRLVTSGVYVWSKPFIRRDESDNEVAVLLMDTQGCFDKESTSKDSASIFVLCNLLSSVQIYNVMNRIQNDLRYLEQFMGYCRRIMEKLEITNHNQPRLILLVRNWQDPGWFPYGKTGGNKYLRELLKDGEWLPEGQRELCKKFPSLFPKRVCFLLPYPGTAVALCQEDCRMVENMTEDFKEHIKDLVSDIFSEEILVSNKLGNSEITGKKWYDLVKIVVDALKEEEFPIKEEPDAKGTEIQANILKEIIDIVSDYEREMKELYEPSQGWSVSEDTSAEKRPEMKTKAITKFTETLRIKYHSENKDHWILLLQKKIEESDASIEKQNEKSTGNNHTKYLYGVGIACFLGIGFLWNQVKH